MEQLYLIGAILLGLLITLLLSKPHKNLSDKLLATFLSIILFYLLTLYFYKDEINWAIEICSALVFAYGPLLYHYTRSQLADGYVFRKKYLLHYLPFLLYIILVSPFLLQGKVAPMPAWIREVMVFLKLASLFSYIFLLSKWLKNHSSKNNTGLTLSWMRKLLGGTLFLAFILFLSYLLVKFKILPAVLEELLLSIFLSLGVIVLTFYGLRHTAVFVPIQLPSFTRKYHKSGLQKEAYDVHVKNLLDYMDKTQIYKNPDLTLAELAEQINLPTNHLSQLLNDSLSTSFTDFVNSYRVKEIITQLQQQEHKKFTLLTLAFNAGFNSKASFNRAFVKITGETPSAYVKKTLLIV